MPPNDAMPTVRSSAEPLGAAIKLVPLVRASRQEGERLRHVPPAVSEALARAGLLQMFLPRGMGGPQHSPLTVFHPVEVLSAADGAAGWCTMLASIMTAFAGWLPPEIGRAMAGTPADLRMAGSIRPQGKAWPVAGGHQVTGQWDFASGVHYARWMLCPCVIMDGDRPALTPAGAPKTRIFWVPAEQSKIIDTWDVIGLRGSGSHDFSVTDVFVPEAYGSSLADPPLNDGPLYNARLFFAWVWTPTVANAFGIARGAIDAFIELATVKGSTSSPTLLRERPMVQARVAEAEAILNSARAYVLESVGTLWDRVSAGESGSALDTPIAQARLAITHGMHSAAKTVDLVFHAGGTNAIYARNPLERYFRDVHVTLQHGAALPQHFESAGKALLGLRPTDPGW